MAAPFKVGPNKGYPSIPTVSGDVANHTLVLEALREAVSIHERRTSNTDDSFVRLGELEELGVINVDQTTKIVVVPDDDGIYIHRDGTSPATSGLIKFGAGIQLETGSVQLKLDLDGIGTDANLDATGLTDLNLTGLTAVNLASGMGVEWNNTTYLEVADSYLSGETPDPDPNLGDVVLLVSGETATAAGVQSIVADIGTDAVGQDLVVEWYNNASAPDTWGYIANAPDPVKFGTYSLWSKDDAGLPRAGWYINKTLDLLGSNFDFRADPFTLEMHIYLNTFASDVDLLDNFDEATGAMHWRWNIDTQKQMNFSFSPTGQNTSITTCLNQIPTGMVTGQWYHLAVTRDSSGDYRAFVDGTQIGSTNNQPQSFLTPLPSTVKMSIGCSTRSGAPESGNQEIYMDNIRITKNVARYTSNFTAPTKPYQGSGGIPAFTVGDPNANMAVEAGDETHTVADFAVVASGVINLQSTGAFDLTAGADSSLNITGSLTVNSTTGVDINDALDVDDSVTVWGLSNSFELSTNDTDAAITSVGLGTLDVVGFTTFDLAPGTVYALGSDTVIEATAGAAAAGAYYRAVTFMCAFDGADAATSATDDSIYGSTITFAGNAQLDTAQFKFGTASLLLDGTGDYVTVPDSDQWDMGSDDFTAEGWFRWAVDPGTGTQSLISFYDDATNNRSWLLDLNNNQLRFAWSTDGTSGTYDSFQGSFNPVADQWYHIAVARSGTSCKTFVDGVQIGSASLPSDIFYSATAPLALGSNSNSGGANYFNGWIDSVRITKGHARYTEAFAAPTEAFGAAEDGDGFYPDVGVLLPFDGSDGAVATTDAGPNSLAITLTNGAQLDSNQKKFGTTSLLLDGTNDYASVANHTDLALYANEDFTAECWIRLNAAPDANKVIFNKGGVSGSVWPNWLMNVNTSSQIFAGVYRSGGPNATVTSTTTLSVGVWYHIAMTWDHSIDQLEVWIDGTSEGTDTSGLSPFSGNSNPLNIGHQSNGTNDYFNGWIDDVRITRGEKRYHGDFTPIDAAFPTQATPVGGGVAGLITFGNAIREAELVGTLITLAGPVTFDDTAAFEGGATFNSTVTLNGTVSVAAVSTFTDVATFEQSTGASVIQVKGTLTNDPATGGTQDPVLDFVSGDGTAVADIGFNASANLRIHSEVHAGHIILNSQDTSGLDTDILIADPDVGVLVPGGLKFRVYDSTDVDYIEINHDGTVATIDLGGNTTSLNITNFNETANSGVRIGDGAGVTGLHYLYLNMDNPWVFKQKSTGASTVLSLQSENDAKDLAFTSSADVDQIVMTLSTSQPYFYIKDASASDSARFGHDGTDFEIAQTNTAAVKFTGQSAGVQMDGYIAITDGITAPSAITGYAALYVDSADGDLKIVFADGTVKTIVVDT